MPAPTNAFKAALQESRLQLGCWVAFAEAYCAEITATAEFDWLLIDGEHAPNDLRSTLEQLRVIEAGKPNPVVRLPIGEAWMIKQVLDAGAQSLLIPMVESADQARDLVAAVRYPPVGRRGVGAGLARASGFSQIPDYLTTADREICLLVQIESEAGLGALNEILTIDGVDGVFIGPADLAADMGFLGKPGTKKVQDEIRAAIRKIVKSGKAAGILTADESLIEDSVELGATFVAVGTDVTTYAAAIRNLAHDAKQKYLSL